MARSPEYPDLQFVEPRAWGEGRDGKSVRYLVIHYTAGSERSTSAEDGASYDQDRTDGTSTHYFIDQNSVVQCVLTKDRANAARHKGNRLGIQYELCGTVQTRAQWLDAASLPTLRLAATQAARDCIKYNIPVRRLTVAQTRSAWTDYPNGPKGIVGHVDCTNAYPEDGGDHTDPGTQFPWDVFLSFVQDEIEQEQGMSLDTNDKAFITGDNNRICDPVPFSTGGGEHSPVGDGVLNSSYPKTPGASRTVFWKNLQDLQADVTATKEDAQDAKDNAAAAALSAANADGHVEFLGDDFPNDGNPELDPIVKRLRYVLANPTPPQQA